MISIIAFGAKFATAKTMLFEYCARYFEKLFTLVIFYMSEFLKHF